MICAESARRKVKFSKRLDTGAFFILVAGSILSVSGGGVNISVERKLGNARSGLRLASRFLLRWQPVGNQRTQSTRNKTMKFQTDRELTLHRPRLTGCGILLISLLFALSSARAETAATAAAKAQAAINSGKIPAWWTPTLPDEIKRDVEAKGQRLAGQLELGDEAKTRQVAEMIGTHYGRVWAWHQQADEKLAQAWAAWDEARDNSNGKQKDELKALTIMTERIDPLFAEFTPQIQTLLSGLKKEIGEEKTLALLDRITRSPGAQRTYNAYLAMVPELTEAEKAILWERMAQAREDSLAAWSDKEIVRIFKKYKLRNEFSLDYFGYGYQKRYQAWAAAGAKPKE
jgi:hypothetical protein